MQLNIGNSTKQDHDFTYRLPNNPSKIVVMPIPKGSQIDIKGEREELESILDQHRQYGLIDVKEFDKDKKFSGLVFSFNGKIDMDKLAHAREHHNEVIDENANNIRKATTAASAASIEGEASAVDASVKGVIFELEELPNDRADTKRLVKQKMTVEARTGLARH